MRMRLDHCIRVFLAFQGLAPTGTYLKCPMKRQISFKSNTNKAFPFFKLLFKDEKSVKQKEKDS